MNEEFTRNKNLKIIMYRGHFKQRELINHFIIVIFRVIVFTKKEIIIINIMYIYIILYKIFQNTYFEKYTDL